jgi:hypothetical protein
VSGENNWKLRRDERAKTGVLYAPTRLQVVRADLARVADQMLLLHGRNVRNGRAHDGGRRISRKDRARMESMRERAARLEAELRALLDQQPTANGGDASQRGLMGNVKGV